MSFEKLVKALPVALYRARVEGYLIKEIEFLNDWVEKITGWSKEEVEGNAEKWVSKVHPEDKDKLPVAIGGSVPVSRVYRLFKKGGGYAYLLDTIFFTDSGELFGVLEDISTEVEHRGVFSAVDGMPQVGILIYRETVVYANRGALEFFGYTREELYRKPVYEIVTPRYRESIKGVVERRLRGERFEKVYTELPVLLKDGTERYLFAFTKTIQWEGKPAGFVVFFDITKRVRYERFFKVLKKINMLMRGSIEKEELLKKVCNILVEEAGFRMVWVGLPDKKSGYVKPLYACGHGRDYAEKVKISVREDVPQGLGPTGRAFREGGIAINPDTRTNPAMEPWRSEMLRRGFMSSCAIPIKTDKEVILLNIYSSVPYMFTDEELELLAEIQRDLTFVFKNIERDVFIKTANIAIEKGHEWVLITDSEGRILHVNKAAEEISGYSADELLGKNPRIFKSGYHGRDFYGEMWETIKSGNTFQAIFVNKKKSGEIFYLDQMIVPVVVGEGELRFVALGKDITTEKFFEKELSRLRYTDSMTGLFNREGFLTAVNKEIEKSAERTHALFILDISGLASINEVYGAHVGDKVLKEVALRLKKVAFDRDIVGKVGGDEFALFAKDLIKDNITTVLDKLISIFSKPIKVNGKKVSVGANIGAALYPYDARNAQTLMEKAFIALSFAKREGENSYSFFSHVLNAHVERYLRLKGEIGGALKEGRFVPYFQAYYATGSRKVVGFEVLLRLKTLRGEFVSPLEFIPVLERTGLIGEVEGYTLKRVLRLTTPGRVAFALNISPRSFKDRRFVEELEGSPVPSGKDIVLEITEKTLMEDIKYTKEFLSRIKSKGIRVAVDDFGTGYSSLAYLEELPVDILKIDISFTRKITENERTRAIVESIVELANGLGMETVAEGVETEEQLLLLEELGCTYVQGFYLAKPLPWEKAQELL